MAKKKSKAPGKKTQKESMRTGEEQDTSSKNGEQQKTDTKKVKIKKETEISFEEKYNEINDKYLRLYSEFDNFRRRTLKEKIEMSKTASEEVISEMLTILDDFERAIKSSEESQDCEITLEGISLIYNKFKGILEKKGVSAIEVVGKDFDTDFHEAVTYIPAPSDDLKGKIVDEIQKGYILNEKVIRYAKVVIGQ